MELTDEEAYRRLLARSVFFIEEERISVVATHVEGTDKVLVEILVDGKDPEGECLARLLDHMKKYGAVKLAKA